MQAVAVLRLRPLEYAHVTNENTNITELIVGPQNRPVLANETITKPATAFHVVPAGAYCRIRNPHIGFTKDRAASSSSHSAGTEGHGGAGPAAFGVPRGRQGVTQVRFGEEEIRYNVEPFPLYPDEELIGIFPLIVLATNEALLIEALSRFVADDGTLRVAGERYLRRGPCAYYPRLEERVMETRKAVLVPRDGALVCKALARFTDTEGQDRYDGETYLHLEQGEYIPLPYEEVLRPVEPILLAKGQAIHVNVCKRSYIDPRAFAKGTERNAGETFMVTGEECFAFVPHPVDAPGKPFNRIHVSSHEYAVVRSVAGAKGEAGAETRKVLTNTSYYLQPDEVLEVEPRMEYLLSSTDAILLTATEDFTDTRVNPPQRRVRGDRWLVHGPCRFIPSRSVNVVADGGQEVRGTIRLTDGEGFYVRDIHTGEVRAVFGPTTHMLGADEELWEKPVPPQVEKLLKHRRGVNHFSGNRSFTGEVQREKWEAVMYQVPNRSVTQLYNSKTNTARTVFGPARILLEPEEDFTVVSLSGSPRDPQNPNKFLPKKPNSITSLHLFLGPSNMSDVVSVETRDHAQLALHISYGWFFDIQIGDAEAAKRCFSVNDFVGDACSFTASRIRAAVASLPFEEFHKHSAKYLREAVFGVDEATGHSLSELRFEANNLVLTSVDTQGMDVYDARTRQGLMKSVKLAIEMTTDAQQAHAQQVATAREQEARGMLERQRMRDQVANEEQRRTLLEVESRGLSIVNSGKSKAISEAIASAAQIEGEAAISVAELRSKKEMESFELMTDIQRRKKLLLLSHEQEMMQTQVSYRAAMQEIQNEAMTRMVAALGPDTIVALARAGPELQVRLLKSLGLEGYLVTDGSSPINLFRTAAGLTGGSA